ncbi:hypothetical protein BDV59DRAFT_76754 [Aspergillus ambiguus]|uniref:uncharacterized protein n=1 Tax=Aspergillus ambiguus TaxID=176160 RepID=UPI003CCCA905
MEHDRRALPHDGGEEFSLELVRFRMAKPLHRRALSACNGVFQLCLLLSALSHSLISFKRDKTRKVQECRRYTVYAYLWMRKGMTAHPVRIG